MEEDRVRPYINNVNSRFVSFVQQFRLNTVLYMYNFNVFFILICILCFTTTWQRLSKASFDRIKIKYTEVKYCT